MLEVGLKSTIFNYYPGQITPCLLISIIKYCFLPAPYFARAVVNLLFRVYCIQEMHLVKCIIVNCFPQTFKAGKYLHMPHECVRKLGAYKIILGAYKIIGNTWKCWKLG